ncbi:MAG TPA: sugar ABC transporter permease [Firmicutes bacterium]|jgi:ABC-type sugar transport system permease subunit|nr:sugar ABC transporter permease [Bacillota bacterium]
MKLETERKLTFALFLVIPVVSFSVFVIYPIIRSIWLSFHRWDGISPVMTYVGLRNYQRLFANTAFKIALTNNAKWLVFSLLLPPALGLLLALLIDNKLKGERLFQTIYFLPYTITPVAVAAVWRWLYEPRNGLINQLLTRIGLGHLARPWIGNVSIATYAVMAASLWWTTGFSLVLYLSGLRNIPPELLEAADIDGANFLQKFRRVIIPQLLPSTIVVLAMSAVDALRVFDIIYALTRGGPGYATEVLATLMFDFSFNRFDMGLGSAVAVVLLVLSAIIILPYIYHTSKGLEGIRN